MYMGDGLSTRPPVASIDTLTDHCRARWPLHIVHLRYEERIFRSRLNVTERSLWFDSAVESG